MRRNHGYRAGEDKYVDVEAAESNGIFNEAISGAAAKSKDEHVQLITAVKLGAEAKNVGNMAVAEADEQPPTSNTQSQLSPLPRLLRLFCSAMARARERDSIMPVSLKITPNVNTRAVGIKEKGHQVRMDTVLLKAADTVAGNEVDSRTGESVQGEPTALSERFKAPNQRTAQPKAAAVRGDVQLSK